MIVFLLPTSVTLFDADKRRGRIEWKCGQEPCLAAPGTSDVEQSATIHALARSCFRRPTCHVAAALMVSAAASTEFRI